VSVASKVQRTLRKPVREWLRKRGAPIKKTMALQDRGDDVRLSLMAAAQDPYEELPDTCEQWYDPDEHVVVLVLPEPEGDGGGQTDLETIPSRSGEVTGGES